MVRAEKLAHDFRLEALDAMGRIGSADSSTAFSKPTAMLRKRFGTLGRGVFRGPRFQQLDVSLDKSFKLSEAFKLDFRAQAQNVLNHPDFDCVQSNVNSGNFGKAQCLAQSISGGLGAPVARVMSLVWIYRIRTDSYIYQA